MSSADDHYKPFIPDRYMYPYYPYVIQDSQKILDLQNRIAELEKHISNLESYISKLKENEVESIRKNPNEYFSK